MPGGELPAGTVTFLFTDIEGSTKLLAELGRQRYGEVLLQHRVLLRESFERHGGHEVDTQGDAFFVSFRRARDGVAAAADAQRALAGHDWPGGTGVRVRMGIHTGEAEIAGDHYVGISVHRTQRICAAAHGGQVLLSATASDVVADDLPSGVVIRDLGLQRLKDIARPERVFELVIEGLSGQFPPLRTRARRRGLRPLIAAVALLVAGGIAAAVVLATGGGSTKSARVVANSLAVIDPKTNRVVDDTTVGTLPSVTVGREGVWVMNDEDGTVSRIDPATDRVVRTQAIGQVVGGIATGAGAVWASEPIAGTISSINPRSGRPLPTKISGGGRLGAPGPVAVGYGAVWIGVDVPADQLVRYEPQARGVVARIRDVNIGDLKSMGTSGGVAVGGGSVWVSAPDTNEVLRVDPARNAIAGRIPIADGPAAIAFGNGAAWVVVPADDTVWRIDASDQTTRPIRVGRFPTGVAVGEGAVWVANEFAGTVSRVDPASNRLVTTIKVGHSPGAVAVGYGKVWAAVRAP